MARIQYIRIDPRNQEEYDEILRINEKWICRFFNHNPYGVDKDSFDHIHICDHPGNSIARCGFNNTYDGIKRCPFIKLKQISSS